MVRTLAVAVAIGMFAVSASAQQAHVDTGNRRYPAELVGRWVPVGAAAGDTTHLVIRLPLGGLVWADGTTHGAGQWVVHWQSLDPAQAPTPWLCDQRVVPGVVDCEPYTVDGKAPARVLTIKDVRWRELPDSATTH
jgi:hypothetical protein